MDAKKVACDAMAAFSAGDWDSFKAGYASDAVYEEPATQRRVTGPDEIAEAVQGWKDAYPDARGAVTNATGGGDTVTLEITWEGTHTRDLQGPTGMVPASNKFVSLEACQVVTVKDGKITQNRHFFDMLSMLQQMDAAPQ